MIDSGSFFSFFLSHLAGQIPTLLVYLIGILTAILFLGSYPLPSILTLVGLGLNFLLAIGITGLQGYLLTQRNQGEWTSQDMAQILGFINVIAHIFRSIGIGLVILAVFVGRTRVRKPDRDFLDPESRG